jgi:hypothetical protein
LATLCKIPATAGIPTKAGILRNTGDTSISECATNTREPDKNRDVNRSMDINIIRGQPTAGLPAIGETPTKEEMLISEEMSPTS